MFRADSRTLLVGEVNPHAWDSRLALWPSPPNTAGYRLLKMLEWSRMEYFRSFRRLNLCGGRWNKGEAFERATEIYHVAARREVAIVALGSKVAEAFRLVDFEWFGEFRQPVLDFSVKFVRIIPVPHPSGRCRVWNDPRQRDILKKKLEEFRRSKEVVRCLRQN